jgi:hypothetical protein
MVNHQHLFLGYGSLLVVLSHRMWIHTTHIETSEMYFFEDL